jgi:hypothetical protein
MAIGLARARATRDANAKIVNCMIAILKIRKLNWPKRSVLVKMSTGDELNMRIERKTERRKLLI